MARANKLHEPKVLEQQVRRMIADNRSSQLISNFVGQWLQLRNLDAAAPVADIFPDFDDNLRDDFRKEVELLFARVVREDRSVRELLDANYTFLNERLARHYGIPGVYGSQFRMVELPAGVRCAARHPRQGRDPDDHVERPTALRRSVAASGWTSTSSASAPPDPPPNTPGLAVQETHAGVKERQTLRQRMTAHATNPQCASCHQGHGSHRFRDGEL